VALRCVKTNNHIRILLLFILYVIRIRTTRESVTVCVCVSCTRTRNYGHFHPDIVFDRRRYSARRCRFAYGREGGGKLIQTHTHIYALAYQDIDDGRSSRTEEKRTKLNIVLFFFPISFCFLYCYCVRTVHTDIRIL